MNEVDAAGLYDGCEAAFLHRQVDPAMVERAWVAGDGRTAVWCQRGASPAGPARVATAVGDPEQLGPLLALAAGSTEPPERLSVEATAAHVVPPAWTQADTWSWHWMTVDRSGFVEAAAPEGAVVEDLGCDHDDEVEALLEAGNPRSFARPGTPGVLGWWGVRDPVSASLVATGCLVVQPDGSALLRGVTTHPDHRGRGLGRRVSAALTRAALELDDTAALGVYVDNAAALTIYRGLGYAVVHSFISGPLAVPRSSSTAASPSR